jgi:hypothetical protein
MADTWLHIGTSTVPFTTAYESVFMGSFGRDISPNCTSDYLTARRQNYSCVLESIGIADVPPVLTDTFLYASVISDRDSDTAIIPVTLGQERMAYIGPARSSKQLDYRANTFAVRSTCKSIDEWCWLPNINGTFVPSSFSASCGQFVGVPMNNSVPIAQSTVVTRGTVGVVTSFFKDQDWQDMMRIRNASNAFYTVSRLDSQIKPSSLGLRAYFSVDESGPWYNTFIGCNTELVNLTYSYVNGSIRSADITPLHSLELINAIYSPSLLNYNPYITSGAAITATADDSDAALENWIDTLHKHYLSFAAIATKQKGNIAKQRRSTRLVARIPKSALLTLGMLLVLSILFNSFILLTSLWRTSLKKTHAKQVVVSIAGLAASRFDDKAANAKPAVKEVWDLFEERKEQSPSTRIGIRENVAGNHQFVTFFASAIGGKEDDLSGDVAFRDQPSLRKTPKVSVIDAGDAISDGTSRSAHNV